MFIVTSSYKLLYYLTHFSAKSNFFVGDSDMQWERNSNFKHWFTLCALFPQSSEVYYLWWYGPHKACWWALPWKSCSGNSLILIHNLFSKIILQLSGYIVYRISIQLINHMDFNPTCTLLAPFLQSLIACQLAKLMLD